MSTDTIQYVLLDNNGEPVENYHQDDSCDSFVADTIENLIEFAAEMHNYGADDFLEMMDDPDSEYGGYHIVREEVSRIPLSAEDMATLQKLRDDNDED